MPQDPQRYNVDPAEDLHKMKNSTNKKSYDEFVNPGTPQNGLVSMSDRKTGVIAGAASQRLRERLTPASNDSISMSKKLSGNEGKLSNGRGGM